MPLYDAVKDLKLAIERVQLEPHELPLKHLTRRTTVVHLHGAGHEGVGEDVSYEEVLQLAFTDDALPDLTGRAHARLVLGARRRPAGLPAVGTRIGGSRSRAAAGRTLARRCARAGAAARQVRRLAERDPGAARPLPRASLQARRERLVDGRDRRRARRDRCRRRRRSEGPVRGRLARRDAVGGALPPRRRRLPATRGSRTPV